MTDSTKNIELIERYFDDEMTEAEKAMFHQQLRSDVALKHLYDRENLLINTVRFDAAKNHLDFLKELEKALPEVTLEEERSRMPYYAVAASVVILILAGVYFFSTSDPNPTELYAEYFTPYPNVFEPTVRGSEEVTKRSLAFQRYEEGDYQEAADLFSELLEVEREPGMVLLLGNANLALGKTEDARNNFNEVMKASGSIVAPAKWYLSLSYLKDGKSQPAVEILKTLTESNNPYAKKSEQLLKQLAQ
jgi:tetratricopeptide (TPR) repeat protein